jgi:hypothetical protein
MKLKSLSQQLFFNTVRIEGYDKNHNLTSVGTSFVLSHKFENYGEELFLVSNKHVIKDVWEGYIYFTTLKDGEPDIGNPFFIKNSPGFEIGWFGHPRPEIDIAVCPISWQLDLIGKGGTKAFYMKVTSDIIPNTEELESYESIKEVIFVGYPNGIYDRKNYTPIMRKGTTATPIKLDYDGMPQFLIDASVFPGSSGSPVFTYEETYAGGMCNIKLIGILSAVFFQTDVGSLELLPAPITNTPGVKIKQMIDLGVVLKSYLIKETIEEFWRQKKTDIKKIQSKH